MKMKKKRWRYFRYGEDKLLRRDLQFNILEVPSLGGWSQTDQHPSQPLGQEMTDEEELIKKMTELGRRWGREYDREMAKAKLVQTTR